MTLAARHVRCAIFGAGSAGQRLLDTLPSGYDVVAFLDNDRKKHGTRLRGLPVTGPAAVAALRLERVLVASMYADGIHEQLLGLGIPPERIEITSGPQQRVTSDPFPWGCATVLAAVMLAFVVTLWRLW